MKHLLYVEDSPSDLAAAREALREIGSTVVLHGVENAVLAFRFLNRRDPYVQSPRPDAILLDLNLPVMSGLRLLEELRKEPLWRDITVIVFTTSLQPDDRDRAERLGAQFVTKPKHWPDYLDLARRLDRCLDQRAVRSGGAAS